MVLAFRDLAESAQQTKSERMERGMGHLQRSLASAKKRRKELKAASCLAQEALEKAADRSLS